MAEGPSDSRHNSGQGVNPVRSPKEIRRQMVETRAHLTRRIQRLREQVLGTPASSTKGEKKNMTTAKASKKSKSSQKTGSKASAEKSRASHGRTSARTKKGDSRSTSKVKTKVKEVVSKALTGAAIGAVQGAVEAVAPPEKNGNDRTSKGSSQ